MENGLIEIDESYIDWEESYIDWKFCQDTTFDSEDDEVDCGAPCVRINNLFVAPESRGQGLAKRLVDLLSKRLKSSAILR